MPLHQLPNGAWIDPTQVLQIIPRPETSYAGIAIKCHVTVIVDRHDHTLDFSDFGAARDYADSLAAVVNAARGEA